MFRKLDRFSFDIVRGFFFLETSNCLEVLTVLTYWNANVTYKIPLEIPTQTRLAACTNSFSNVGPCVPRKYFKQECNKDSKHIYFMGRSFDNNNRYKDHNIKEE